MSESSEVSERRRDLDAVVHRVLVSGLWLSTALVLAGAVAAALHHGALPTEVSAVREAFRQAVRLDPAGLVSLGLMTLIATPIVRVVASAVTFAHERDWRFAAVTLAVLGVVAASLFFGKE